jgi:hypothetical protein
LASNRFSKLCAGLLLLGVAAPRSVTAQPAASPPTAIDDDTRNSARKLGEEGNKLFAEGDFAGALDRYRRAEALVSVPTLGVRIARCLERLGRLVEATEKYVQVTRTEITPDSLPQHVEAVSQAKAELAALKPRVPSIVVQLDPPEGPAEVTIDDKPLPAALIGAGRSVDPGRHVIVAVRGGKSDKKVIEIGEGRTETVTLSVGAYVPPPSTRAEPSGLAEPLRIAGIVGLALGGASLVAFGVTGGLAMSQGADLEQRCGVELRCGTALHDDADGYNQLRLASTVTLWVGVGLAAVGGGLLVAGSVLDSNEASVGLRVGPTGAALTGAF